MESNLKQKSDTTLVADLKSLVAKERETLTEILHYLHEVESRRLYLPRGYSSLFAFMTGELAYSESAAQRRIEAMRLIRDVPEAEKKIEKGELSLTVASQVGTFFRQENQKRRANQSEPIRPGEKLVLLESLAGTSRRECEKKLAELAPETRIPKEKTRPINEEKTLIQFTAGKNLMGKIQKLNSLLSQQNKTGSLEALFEKLTDLALEKLDPERREQRRQIRKSKKTNSSTLSPPPAEVKSQDRQLVSRHIPQVLRDRIWVRDQGQCQHRDLKTGMFCGSKQRLELDHKFPFALGGENLEENLQLRCRMHNQWRSDILFSRGRVSSKLHFSKL